VYQVGTNKRIRKHVNMLAKEATKESFAPIQQVQKRSQTVIFLFIRNAQ